MDKQEKKAVKSKKTFTGRVISNKMDKTVVVAITNRKLHGLYKKYVMQTKKIKAHDEENTCNIGDTIRVIESRPYSKEKCWRLLDVVERAK